MPGRPYVLEEAALPAVRERPVEVAVLPWGATEPHNLHLPFGTDTIQAWEVAVEAARIAWASGAGVMVLPAIPIGANAQQLDTPLTLNLNPSTQALVLEDLVASLERHGVAKLVIVNGHGGNDFRQMIRELQARTTVFLSAVSWYSVIQPDEHFDEPGDHAGELETSVMMHLRPDWVHPLEDAGTGEARVFRIRALREGWAWAPRDWSQVTDDTGVGDPRASTPDKGRGYFEAVTREIGGFLAELAAADVSDLYVLPGEVEP
jgi:creatinine amidohydrolase